MAAVIFFSFLVVIDSIKIICFFLKLEGSPLVEAQNDKFSGKGGFSFLKDQRWFCFDNAVSAVVPDAFLTS
jgi:hypothetical protein